MPKLWEDTVENHRRAVREAVLDAAWSLVQELGLRGVTMSQIAAVSGIGRATLYKYFPDVDSILVAHHHRQIAAHVERLTALRDTAGTPADRLRSTMLEFARICFHRGRHGGDELFVILHSGAEARGALDQVRGIFSELIAAAADAGQIRTDIVPDELAEYCLNALAAAGSATDEAALGRLVALTTAGLRG